MEQEEIEMAYLEGFLLQITNQIDKMSNGKYTVTFEIQNAGLKPQNS